MLSHRTSTGLFAGVVVTVFASHFALQASATIIATGSVQSDTPWPVPAGELNLGLAPVTTGSIFNIPSLGSTDPHTLSNGTNGNGNASTDLADSQANVVFIDTGATVTYDLGSPKAIQSINTYSDWDSGRSDQNYNVLTSNDNITYTPLISGVSYSPAVAGDVNTQVVIADTLGASLVTAQYVRFDFSVPQEAGGANGAGYTELSINAAVPEPSAIAMAAIGAIGLLLAAIRRRR